MKKNHYIAFLIFVFGLFSTVAFAQNPLMYISSTSGYSTIEGSSYNFSVNLYSASTTAVIINVITNAGTANATDYTPLTMTVTIPAGQISTGILSIPTTNDAVIEANETFTITGTVTSGNTSNTTANSNITIVDNDTPPTIFLGGGGGVEGVSNSETSINLSNPYSSDIVINFAAIPGTAGTSDYYESTVPASITIPAGETYGRITIYIMDDALAEPDETFTLAGTVTTGNTANSTISSIITIRDNDTVPTILMEGSSLSEGGQAMYFHPFLNRWYNSDVVIHFVTTSGTAGTTDYTPIDTYRTISAGDIGTSDIVIGITDDTLDEPQESFTLDGTVTSGNTTNSSFSSTVTLVDNDGLPDFEIFASNTSIEEGSNVEYYVYLTHPSSTDTVIQITTADGTANSSDYTPTTATVTIFAGETFASTVEIVPTILDTLLETNEIFTITGTVLSGNTFNPSSALTITLLDDFNVHAHFDTVTSIAEVGTTFQLLTNDTLHGLPVNASDITIIINPNNLGITVDAQGILTIPSTVPIGGYQQLGYTLCEVANPSNCSTGEIYLQVKSPLNGSYSFAYSDANGDGYTSVGDVITCTISITNIGNAPITNIELASAYNITVLGGPIANLNVGQTDNTTFYSTHIMTQDDINLGAYYPFELELSFKGIYYGYSINDFANPEGTFNLPFSDGIKLNAFVDSNFNGIQDGTEVNFPLGHFNYVINNDGVMHNLYTTPNYLYESNPTTSYTLSYEIDAQYASNYTSSFTYPNSTVASGSGILTYNFPIIATAPYDDLSISLLHYNPPPRPGFEYDEYIVYRNNSSQSVASGTITFTNDSAVSLIGNSGTVHTFTFTDLLPFESRHICLRLQTPTIPSVALGQLVTNTASISIPASDIDPLNNTSSLTQTIVGSWDPNDKTERHGGEILHSGFTTNDYLTYTIHFENTGTANAINIKVQDVLDTKLEPSSLKMVDASANYSLERIEDHLTWTFSGIDLPPSIDDSITGKGYVTFQVKPKAGYTIGDVIPNKGDIYFDFNPAIETNICTTQFVATLANPNFAFNAFSYYPNPTQKSLFLSNSSTINTVEITSVLGQLILTKNVNAFQTEINLSTLSKGVYFVRVTSKDQNKTVKISKE